MSQQAPSLLKMRLSEVFLIATKIGNVHRQIVGIENRQIDDGQTSRQIDDRDMGGRC